MTKSVYLTATEGNAGTRQVFLAAVEKLRERYPNFAIFRPFTNGQIADDHVFQELLAAIGREDDLDRAWGTNREALFSNEEAAMNQLVKRFTDYTHPFDAVLIVGVCDGDTIFPGLLSRIGRAAAHLGTTVVPIISGALRSAHQISHITRLSAQEISGAHAPISALIVTEAGEEYTVEDAAELDSPAIVKTAGTAMELTDSDTEILVSAMEEESQVVTPLSFTASLIARARANRKRIVLPESTDDRILKAADELISREVAEIILLGDAQAVAKRAAELGLDLSAAQIVSPQDPELLDKYATEFARLREKKGVTYEQAREKVQDLSYFGTMMVHLGDADGMVSGAIHTTAHTIVPSFQIIKTKPGADLVSSCFLMLMEDRVYVYGDCAVTPNPDPAQLASIAISSAETATQFGVDPRVAMLSYSTGTSGKGPDVDAVVEATAIARERQPQLMLEGPIQYDAAVDATVAATKLPDSAVAGRATVFIFPNLSAGNIGYKAVQRSAGAVAVGPVLQGLNKPVNDLSRGALVEDIVNTVAITAIQAQG
ncbi:phosphate acetyltransferase [Arcanobacterium hippocoleae]|uniref:Phosphate acetyltransferase n=1 Tax=Arcanobacterium hippocoleae TaxID=149017 RepID=A0ABU1T5F1_9ACTO|nr:phosphate acetyltransferase [Arcanobacterium hippocoleae]MDR6940111.1 phosphate acetyltransferase [Arcanobacterium hippocoleae]